MTPDGGQSPVISPGPVRAQPEEGAPAGLGSIAACLQQGLGHELSNQLVALQGMIRLLETEQAGRLDAEGRDYLRRMAAGVRRIHALVAALAEVARLARPAEAAEAVDAAEVAAEAVAEIRPLCPALTIEYHGAQYARILTLPRPALRQVFVQLLRRLAAGTSGDGVCRVEILTTVSAAEVEVRLVGDRPFLPAGQWQRLFEPFADRGSGTGLELFLARRLVERWGGTIRAEASATGGLVFVFTAPRAEAGAADKSEVADHAERARGSEAP
jgi:signal transduction histidine kinase